MKTLFTKIIEGEIPADFVYKDEHCVAIKDINPKAPSHFLVIPRKPIPSIIELEEQDKELVAHLIFTAQKLAQEHAFEGYKLQFNVGKKGGQEVFHLHLHLLGWK